jgi:hypothetical protein
MNTALNGQEGVLQVRRPRSTAIVLARWISTSSSPDARNTLSLKYLRHPLFAIDSQYYAH